MHKKIAILCMSMNIGGAETHILELAKQLKRDGNEITVYSNGGVYVKQLEVAGIRHVWAPMHKNTLKNLIYSYRIIYKDFKKNRPSIVHSHTRISNFVGGKVCKRLSIPMVTTVHGHFYSDFFSRLVANWGVRSLAVSEDLKEYLISNYNYDPKKVILTCNGIDTARFSNLDSLKAKEKLGLQPDQKTILFVSRLDRDTSGHIFKFLELAPIIYRKNPNAKVLIVGDGEDFTNLSAKVDLINQECGAEFIRMEGAHTDIEQYTASSDLFIGVSRAALEAMATGVPTILMGQFGFLGLYSDHIKEAAIKTNLTCRQCPYPADESIIDLIDNCLKSENLSKAIIDGKKLVDEHYSLGKMAETAMIQYQTAIQDFRPNDYIISGYYGCKNFGDDLTLACLMDHLKEKKGTVLTCNVDQTYVPQNVEKIHRFSMRKINKRMKETKVVLMGSGSLLQDTTSFRSFFYYYVILRMAIHNRCKTMLFANGIGPIIRKSNLKRLKKLLKHIDCITLRDEKSYEFLKNLGFHGNIHLTADDSFSANVESIIPLHQNGENKRKIVGINLKLPTETSKDQISSLADGLFYLAQKHNLYYKFIPFHYEQDYPSLHLLSSMLPNTSELIDKEMKPKEIISHIAAVEYNIFERLHGQILSTIMEIPFLPISYDLKISSFAHQVGIESYLLEHQNLNKEALISSFEKVLAEQDVIKKKLSSYKATALEKVRLNKEKLLQLIEDY